MKLIKFKTIKDEVVYANPAYLINIKVLNSLVHVAMTDFGFDITKEEWENVRDNFDF